jgi:xanthine dehydrogenase YagR molybdenum-binding subunit
MSRPLVGAPRSRVEGPLTVTGRTTYTADGAPSGMLHAVIVASTIANGRIIDIDESHARAAPGVVEIMTHRNAPRVDPARPHEYSSLLFLLQNDAVEFDRQPVAVVIADTFERAIDASELVQVRYEATPPHMSLHDAPKFVPQQIFGDPAKHERGAPLAAFRSSAVQVKQTYRTPTEHHNPIETHGTVAWWDGDRLTLYDATQWVFGVQYRLAAVFGMSPKKIRVIAPFVGGAFGSKGQPWSHVPLAAMAARLVGRPVKLLATRRQMFGWVGHRPQTVQTISLGSDSSGQLQSIIHEVVSETSRADEYVEPCGIFSRDLYATPNYAMSHELRRLHISKPTFQRAPGESTGSFALESAMDELAYELEMDPVELRLRNYAETAPDSGKPYTSKNLRTCYELASERFGWSQRDPRPRSMRSGRMLAGMGMATASRSSFRSATSVRIRMNENGSVIVQCGTIEQGTGSPTVFAQLAAEILEIPADRVRFEFGDTNLPDAPLAAGSQTAASVGSAVAVAAQKLRARLNGGAVPRGGVELEIREEPSEEEERYEQHAFGAHFAHVEVDPDLGTVQVTRFVCAFDAGRILNEKTARSQFLGGTVWGISMALFEKTRYDERCARIMNASLADYLIPTNADVPNVEIVIAPFDDPNVNPAHVRGIGEVAMTGSAAAVANAVYHATGIRVRELPITPEKLLS